MHKMMGILICVLLVILGAVAGAAQEVTLEITPPLPTIDLTLPIGATETPNATPEPTSAGDTAPAATPMPTEAATAEATDMMDAEATDEAPTDDMAYYRVAHFSPDAPSAGVEINGEASEIEAVAFPELSDWYSVDAGTYSFAVTPEGGEAAVQADVSLEAGTWSTVAVIGSAENGTLMLHEIEEDYDQPLPGTGGLTIFNALESDIMVNFNRDEIPYATELTFPGVIDGGVSQLTIQDDAGVFDFQFVETQDPTNILGEILQDDIQENAYTFIALVGPADDPQVVLDVTDRAEVNMELGILREPGTIIDAAASDENLTAFVDAVEAAGLTDLLTGEGPYTVFVPANFVLDGMEMPAGEALADILSYHVVEGKLLSRGVTSAQSLETLTGEPLTVMIDGNNIFVNDAQIIAVNIPATNGVIHMINGVLMPASGE